MKKSMLVFLLMVLSSTIVFAQENDQITLKKKRYFLNEKEINGKELQTILNSYPESAEWSQKAQLSMTIGGIPLAIGVGGALVGSVINLASGGSGAGLGLAVVGCGIALVGLPFLVISSTQMKKAINLYNTKKSPDRASNMRLEVGLTKGGLGMTLNF